MPVYEPDKKLIEAVLAGIALPLGFIAGAAFKLVPFKDRVMSKALALAIPMSLRAIASAYPAGARIPLTKHGELTEETKRSVLTRIAAWFVPSEVKDVTKALQDDIVRMTTEGYAEEAWRLEATNGEIVIVVLNTSFLKVTADTAVDAFFNSMEAVKKFKDKLPLVGAK